MCRFSELQTSMKVVRIMSIIQIVLAVGVLIAGAVAASYKIPDYCQPEDDDPTNDIFNDDPSCQDDRDDINRGLTNIALFGTIPGAIPFVFGIIGVVASLKQSKCLVGVMIGFSIVAAILCAIGILIPMYAAAFFSTICALTSDSTIRSSQEGRDFCDRYAGSLWAVVALNIILCIYELIFTVILCIICCSSSIWTQAENPPAVMLAPMGAPATQIPTQPIPEAAPVKMG